MPINNIGRRSSRNTNIIEVTLDAFLINKKLKYLKAKILAFSIWNIAKLAFGAASVNVMTMQATRTNATNLIFPSFELILD